MFDQTKLDAHLERMLSELTTTLTFSGATYKFNDVATSDITRRQLMNMTAESLARVVIVRKSAFSVAPVVGQTVTISGVTYRIGEVHDDPVYGLERRLYLTEQYG
jgi:hypothetical protein